MFDIKSQLHRWLVSGLAVLLFLTANSLLAATVIPSTQFSLGGFVNTSSPSNFNLADLEAFALANPASQKSVSVVNNSGGTDVYTGISLNSFLNSYIKTDPGVPKIDILRDYLVASGTDGYKAVFSLGELSTNFGNQNDIIAYQLNGANLTGSGFARIVAPGDIKAGRWVSNLASLEIGHVAYTPGLGGVSTELTVNGLVATPMTYTAANLPGSLTPSTVTVSTANGNGTPLGTFTGVSLWQLLNQSGILLDPNVKNDILTKYVVATGTDGYSAVFSLGELAPNFGNQADLLAFASLPGSPLGSDGFTRTVVPGDIRGGRYVSNLTSLTVMSVTAVPLPPSALLLVTGMFAIGLRRDFKTVNTVV